MLVGRLACGREKQPSSGVGRSPWWRRRTIVQRSRTYNGTHAYLADGRWQEWRASLESFEARLDADVTLHVGHGAPGTKALLADQRHYIHAFVAALDANADAVTAGDHRPVLAAFAGGAARRRPPVPAGPEHRRRPLRPPLLVARLLPAHPLGMREFAGRRVQQASAGPSVCPDPEVPSACACRSGEVPGPQPLLCAGARALRRRRPRQRVRAE